MKEQKNKKQIFALLGLLTLIIIIVSMQSATAQIEQPTNIAIDVEVRVQRTAENVYELSLTNQASTEKKIINVASPAFSTHTFKLNYALNESAYCTRSSNIINQYSTLTNTMSSMLGVCESAVKQYNVSESNLRLLSEAQLKQTEFESLWNVEKNKRETLEKTSNTCETELEQIKRERDQLQNTANLANTRGVELTKCTEDLEKAENAKTNNLILGAVLGLAGGYFFWGRKDNNADYSRSRLPPEQEDAMSDYY
jgi:predicted transcriptional regulator